MNLPLSFHCALAWQVRKYLKDNNMKNGSTCCSEREQLKRVALSLLFFAALKGLWKYGVFIVSLLLGHKLRSLEPARGRTDWRCAVAGREVAQVFWECQYGKLMHKKR